MSSKPTAPPPTGLSKSAAKKRAKKAAKAQSPSAASTNPPPTLPLPAPPPNSSADQQQHHHHHHHSASSALPSTLAPLPPSSIPDPLDPAFFNFSGPGSYPIDVQYDNTAFYDEVDVPINPNGGFPGSYSIDYNLSLQNGSQLAGLSTPFNITHDDLISAANELYKRMADPEFGSDDAYWSSLPPHIRQFIRDAVPFTGSVSQGTPGNASSQRTMYQMAQQIVQAASQGMGLGQGMGASLMSGAAAAAAAAANGQMNGRQQYPRSGSLGEELGFHRHPDAAKGEDEYEDEDDVDEEPEHHVTSNGDAPKKKNKKKKKKGGAGAGGEPPVPPAAALPPLPPPPQPVTTRNPPRQPAPPQSQPQPHQTALFPPPPPVAPTPAHAHAHPHAHAHAPTPAPAPAPTPTTAPTAPPPSSRAAGKQPMGTTTAPAANPPARSARAAGKAPASSATPSHNAHTGHTHNHPPAAASKSTAKGKAPVNAPPAKIWTQSSAEDRENIRLFWLGLSEAERRDLLRIEKDAVLRKMKEQHRHSCGCAVCGRKKVNIEMELDQLYEQYYEELRSYAAESRAAANGQRPAGVPGAGPFPGSVEVDAQGTVTRYDHRAPELHEHEHDELDGEESDEYDDEDDYGDEDELDDDDIGTDEADVGDDIDDAQPPPAVLSRPPAARPLAAKTAAAPRSEGGDDFLSFGSNLATIKGGILTIADDMLKNDGSKFLEMMEQLAIRRSAREEQNLRDIQEETDDEDDADSKDEPLTDKERAEEGKRMFQIFAARMFEQRVLQAYRERVAKQREEQLLRELEEEEDSKRAREEKKAKEAQKKKDKKRAQKQKAEEEKAAREAELAEEQRLAKVRAEEQERERLKKQEEERTRREAVKRAAQEEAQRQANERRKRQQEEKEREEEAARKKREREEKARKEREAREKELKEKERREKEARQARDKAEKERVAKDKAEKQERDRQAKEVRDKADKERQAKIEADRAERARKEEAARKEREASEQAKIIAAQQAQRERAKTERAAADKAAAERAAAARAVPPHVAPASVPLVVKSPLNGSTPQPTPPPTTQPSPAKADGVAGARPGPVGLQTPSRSTQKAPSPYHAQPIAPVGVAYQRMPVGVQQPYGAPSLRGAYPAGPSPVFSPPRANGSSTSPIPPPRGFNAEPSAPSFDHGMRTAPIGMGFPPVKQTARIPSIDDTFSPTTPPIGMPSSSRNPSIAGEIGSFISGPLPPDEYRPSPAPAPIAPPSNPGPIGRPPAYLDQPSGPASGSSALRSSSPAPPDQVFGSAALGGDDEIVQPQQRRPTASWDMSPAPPGAGRWSASPSIWGTSAGEPSAVTSGWGAPGSNLPPPPGIPLSPAPGNGVLGQRTPFGAMGGPFGGVGVAGVGGVGGVGAIGTLGNGVNGVGGGGGMGAAVGGGYTQGGLFSPTRQLQHPHPPPHHQS